MNNFEKIPLSVMLAAWFLAAPVVTDHGYAADAQETNPLQLYRGEDDSYLQATFKAEFATFSQHNSWFGNSRDMLGKKSNSWWESTLRPGIEGSLTAIDSQKFYGRLDAVQANTGGGIDAAGSNINYGDVSDLRWQQASVGWKSGKLLNALGEDFLDISFGRQQYKAGTGFILWTEGSSGFDRGAYWLAGRNTSDYMGLIRMRKGAWTGDLLYFKVDDNPDTDTNAFGTTVDYAVETKASIGGGFYVLNSDSPARDAMKFYDIRAGLTPFAERADIPALKTLKFDAEYVYEDKDNGLAAGHGWYAAAGYQFDQIPWNPLLTYRYASFDENFYSFCYGSSDWGSWYQGEILGEYVLGNSNLDSHMFKLTLKPIEPITLNLIYYSFAIHKPAVVGLANDDYAEEWNAIIDWSVNSHLSFSLAGAYTLPDTAAIELTGGHDNWSYLMMYGSVSF